MRDWYEVRKPPCVVSVSFADGRQLPPRPELFVQGTRSHQRIRDSRFVVGRNFFNTRSSKDSYNSVASAAEHATSGGTKRMYVVRVPSRRPCPQTSSYPALLPRPAPDLWSHDWPSAVACLDGLIARRSACMRVHACMRLEELRGWPGRRGAPSPAPALFLPPDSIPAMPPARHAAGPAAINDGGCR